MELHLKGEDGQLHQGMVVRISDDLRYDGIDHLLIPTSEKKKKRCVGERCLLIIRTMCEKCNVGLCLGSNFTFHQKRVTNLNKCF